MIARVPLTAVRERFAEKESVRSHACGWLEAEAPSHRRGTTIGLHLDRCIESSVVLTLYGVSTSETPDAENDPMELTSLANDGVFVPARIAEMLRTTNDELARTVGLGKDAVQRRARVPPDKTHRRLREMVEVLNKVEPRFGSALIAYAWYRSEPLAGFDGMTAMQLVREGRATDVLDYVDAVDAGVHA